jgi:hypothetical protein
VLFIQWREGKCIWFEVEYIFFDDFRSIENFSPFTRVYVCKWTTKVYHLKMAKFWSILGPTTNLIGRKCCVFNEEKENVFGWWLKTYFLMIFDPFW